MSEQHNMASYLSDKQPNRKDSRQINFRVSEQDYLKLSQSAKTLNMSVPAFVKKKAQGARIVAPLIGAEEAQALTRQLAKIGSQSISQKRQSRGQCSCPSIAGTAK